MTYHFTHNYIDIKIQDIYRIEINFGLVEVHLFIFVRNTKTYFYPAMNIYK